jgi:serpin B
LRRTLENKIKEIVNVEMIDEGSALVLINALYFKGDWFEHFKKGSTTSQEFYVKEGSTVNVEMMKRDENRLLQI